MNSEIVNLAYIQPSVLPVQNIWMSMIRQRGNFIGLRKHEKTRVPYPVSNLGISLMKILGKDIGECLFIPIDLHANHKLAAVYDFGIRDVNVGTPVTIKVGDDQYEDNLRAIQDTRLSEINSLLQFVELCRSHDFATY